MTTQSVMPVASPEFIASLGKDYNASVVALDNAKAALIELSGAQLPFLVQRLDGIAKVTEETWASDWKEAQEAAYKASGRSKQTDAAKLALSMGSAVSLLKVAVIALTHNVQPLKGETITTYVNRARPILQGRGTLKGKVKEAAERENRKAPVNAGKAKLDSASAAFALAGKDQAFADKLARVAADYREEFEDWFDMLMIKEARRAPASETINA